MATWDILSFDEADLRLHLSNKDGPAIFGYPWASPVSSGFLAEEKKPEAIKIPEDELLVNLSTRARAWAILRASQLARSGLEGRLADSEDEMISEALKACLRKLERGVVSGSEFAGLLRRVATIRVIPDSYWKRVASIMGEAPAKKLKNSFNALQALHPGPGSLPIELLYEYLSRAAWFQNEFEMIATVGKQAAIIWKSHPLKVDFSRISDRAAGMLKKAQIEQEKDTIRPWQRSVPTKKKAIRVGPKTSTRVEKPANEDETEDQ